MSPFDSDMSPAVDIDVAGIRRRFDVDDPTLPDWIKDNARSADNYPYKDKYKHKKYNAELYKLHVELVKLQYWQQSTNTRVVCVFEGRDAAGKGGSIGALRAHMNPRSAHIVALPKPSDREMGQWYFQRYTAHLPGPGELTLFDRSWYNRAGVEPVMGFCTPKQHKAFLREAPAFEASLTRDGIFLFKFWLAISQETQLKRFHDRRHDPRKIWKLSPMDLKALVKWHAYSAARDTMLSATHTTNAPWTIVRMNDKKRGRINMLRHFLGHIPYDGKDETVVKRPDPKIVINGPAFRQA